MKSIHNFLSLIVIALTTIYTVEAQETMYIYKDGAIVGEHLLTEVDSVIFYNAEAQDENTVTDIDGNVYNTVIIGTQTWMAENLKTTTYNDGSSIVNETDNTTWMSLTTGAYCWYNNDEDSYKEPYGALYNWYVVETDKVCPSGWHVPSDSDWQLLEVYLGMDPDIADNHGLIGSNEGAMLKTTSGWYSDGNGTNEYNFSAYPSGIRNSTDGTFSKKGLLCSWWSSSKSGSSAYYYALDYRYTSIYRYYMNKFKGYSIRCVKD